MSVVTSWGGSSLSLQKVVAIEASAEVSGLFISGLPESVSIRNEAKERLIHREVASVVLLPFFEGEEARVAASLFEVEELLEVVAELNDVPTLSGVWMEAFFEKGVKGAIEAGSDVIADFSKGTIFTDSRGLYDL